LRYLGREYFDITAINGRSSLPRFAARPVQPFRVSRPRVIPLVETFPARTFSDSLNPRSFHESTDFEGSEALNATPCLELDRPSKRQDLAMFVFMPGFIARYPSRNGFLANSHDVDPRGIIRSRRHAIPVSTIQP
jgi:hypothetical protein